MNKDFIKDDYVCYKNKIYYIIKKINHKEYLCMESIYNDLMIINGKHLIFIKYKESNSVFFKNNIYKINEIVIENNKIYYNISKYQFKSICQDIEWKVPEEELSPIK